jgi:hypothetical protein
LPVSLGLEIERPDPGHDPAGRRSRPHLRRRSPREDPLPNFIWPSLRRRDVGPAGALGRVIHWLGVIVAGLCAMLALEFAVEGWATRLSRDLLLTAIVLAVVARAARYVLARE